MNEREGKTLLICVEEKILHMGLSPKGVLLYGIFSSLPHIKDQYGTYCTISYKQIGDFLECSNANIRRLVQELMRAGLVKSKRKDGFGGYIKYYI